MSYPKTIFIDTEIFDSNQYNFFSASFSAFREAVKDKGFTLLLPAPTLQEIERHISDRADSALNVLKNAQRKAPFLTKLPNWPHQNKPFETRSLHYKIVEKVKSDLKIFLNLFKVKKLGYDNIDINEIMSWYDNQKPPFGEGKKRKEFPDAFAVAIIRNYSQSKDRNIAVISGDSDFERACSPDTKLLYFKSLSSFTEALMSGDKKVDTIRGLLEKDKIKIAETIKKQFTYLTFFIEANWEGDVQDVEAEDIDFTSLNIVGIGEHEISLIFEATIDYSAYVNYGDLETASYDKEDDVFYPWETIEGTVHDAEVVKGIMKARLSDDEKSIEDIHIVEFEDDSVLITSIPEEEY